MSVLKPWQWVAIGLGLSLGLYFVYFHLQSFGDMSFLSAIVGLEIIVTCLWSYNQRVFALILITFIWAGVALPFQNAALLGRWVVLAAGAGAGIVVWVSLPHRRFKTVHLVAAGCILTAAVSASVSQYVQMAGLKALSLALLLVYCATGARLAALGREERFFSALVLGAELVTYFSAISYLAFGNPFWGNPNSLGAAMSIGAFPLLLWGWISSDGDVTKLRRLAALLVCTYLVRFSLSRAGMITVSVVTVTFCLCLHRYKLLVKIVAAVLFVIAVGGVMAPEKLDQQLEDFKDAFLYKGHKQQGMLGSRMGPWQESINSIKEHPWFGTGYGTSPTGVDPGLYFGRFNSSAETSREHGSSYITIAEWVGLVGVSPFIALMGLTLLNVWRVCRLMRWTSEVRYYSIPLGMVVLAGFVHASFEDWMFAVGSYLSFFFWACAFILVDLVPDVDAFPKQRAAPAVPRRLPADYQVAVSHQ